MPNRAARVGGTASSLLTIGAVLVLFFALATNSFGVAQVFVQLFSFVSSNLNNGFTFVRCMGRAVC